jgi:mono/diheme cytochrome c family protein
MMIVASLALATSAYGQSAAVKRGSYLVNTVMTCGNCHTPKGPDGADIKEKAFSGGLEFDEPPFKVTASNITPDRETGIGKWTRGQIRAALLTGKRPNGTPLAEIMPTSFYAILTPRDSRAIVAYLKSLKPIRYKVPDPVYKIALPHHLFPGAEKPMPAAAMRNKVRRGFYLVTIAHCMECHTPMTQKGRDFVNDLGKGGFELKGPWGVSVSRNITSHKEKGIGAWTDAEIKRAITQGIRKDGSKLKPPMGYSYYAGMTNADLDAMIAYLRTVPPKE